MKVSKVIVLALISSLFYSYAEASNFNIEQACCEDPSPVYRRIAIKLSIRIGSRIFNRQLRKDRKQRLQETENDAFYSEEPLNFRQKSFKFYEIDSPLLKMSSLELTEDLKLRIKMPNISEYANRFFKVESEYKIRTKIRFKANLGSKLDSPSIQIRLSHSVTTTNHKFVFQARAKYRFPEETFIFTASFKWDY